MLQKNGRKFYDCNVRLREKCFLGHHKQKRLLLRLFSPVCLFSLNILSLYFCWLRV